MNKKLLVTCLALGLIASTIFSEPSVIGMYENGTMTWQQTNYPSGTYRVEWVPDMANTNWSSRYDHLRSGAITGSSMTVAVPVYLRVAVESNAPVTQVTQQQIRFTNHAVNTYHRDFTTQELLNLFSRPDDVAFADAANGSLSLRYQPDLSQSSDIILFQVVDPDGRVVTGKIDVVVVSLPPLAGDIYTNAFRGLPVTIDFGNPNSDPGVFPFALKQLPVVGGTNQLAILATNTVGVVKVAYTSYDLGTNSFPYVLINQPGVTSTGLVCVTVLEKLPPTASAIHVATLEGLAVHIPVTLSNSSPIGANFGASTGQTFIVRSAGVTGDYGRVTGENPNLAGWSTLVYQPPTHYSFFGEVTFDYVMVDEYGSSSTGNVTVTINASNTAPNAISDTFYVSGTSSTGLDVFSNDVNAYDWNTNRALSIAAFSATSNGVITAWPTSDVPKTAFIYTPTNTSEFAWTDSFSYSVTDGVITSELALVTIQAGDVFCIVDVSSGSSSTNYPVTFTNYIDTEELVATNSIYKREKIVFRYTPGGTFMAGSPSGECYRVVQGENSETPQRLANVGHFYMAVFELTQQQYLSVVGSNPSTNNSNVNHPLESVSPNNFHGEFAPFTNGLFIAPFRFRSGLDAMLPSADEWEYACRAGTTSTFNTGFTFTEPSCDVTNATPTLNLVAWTDENSGNVSKEVGLLEPNAFGLYDMHGNIFEATRTYSIDSARAMIRGGAYNLSASFSRSAAKLHSSRSTAFSYVGYRMMFYRQ